MNALPVGTPSPLSTLTLTQRLRRQLDHVMAYLPVVFMGLLAMVTYWLVRHTPEPTPLVQTQAARHVPDYFMREFSLKVYAPDGRLEFRVQGQHAEHFPDTDALEVTQPRVTKVDASGQTTDATARLAITTPEGQRVELKGEAVVRRWRATGDRGQRERSLELRSDYLFIDLEHDRIQTDRPVEVVHGSDRFTADALDYDHNQGLTRLTGRVRGQLQPRQVAR